MACSTVSFGVARTGPASVGIWDTPNAMIARTIPTNTRGPTTRARRPLEGISAAGGSAAPRARGRVPGVAQGLVAGAGDERSRRFLRVEAHGPLIGGGRRLRRAPSGQPRRPERQKQARRDEQPGGRRQERIRDLTAAGRAAESGAELRVRRLQRLGTARGEELAAGPVGDRVQRGGIRRHGHALWRPPVRLWIGGY